ncbi:MAG: NADH-quinone oxidoreductase subunit J [Pseudomonadota bacterium]
MDLTAFFFYLFASLLIASAFMVITARNPVHAVLFLIFSFFNAAGLFVLQGAEFLALILIVVYVGAVAVLFLFVVMMLDVDFASLRAGFVENAWIGVLIGLVIVGELLAMIYYWSAKVAPPVGAPAITRPGTETLTNTEAIGRVLYTEHVYFFELAGLVLLVAMVGAIVLTLRERQVAKRQSVAAQVARNPAEAVDVVDVPSGGAVFPVTKTQPGE